MRAPQNGGSFHMVCPRLLELDARHGEHMAGQKYPLHPDHFGRPRQVFEYGPGAHDSVVVEGAKPHGKDCGCLIDPEGHSVTTLVMPLGSEIEDDHPSLTCNCGRLLVVGERIR